MDEEKKAWESELEPAKRNATVIQRYREAWLGYGELLAADENLDKQSKAVGAAMGAVWDGKASITPELVEEVRKLTGLLRWSIKWAEEVAEMPAKEVKPYLKERIQAISLNDYENLAGTSDITPQGFARYVFGISASHLEISLLLVRYDLTEEFRQWIMDYAVKTFTASREQQEAPPPRKFNYTPPEMHNFPNDKVSKAVRSMTPQEFEHGTITAIERKANAKKKISQVETLIRLDTGKLKELGLDRLTPLQLYAVYTCFSIQSANNNATTIQALWRAMTGKDGDDPPSEEIAKEIEDGLVKAMSLPLFINSDGIRKAYMKDLKKDDIIGTLLPIKIGPARINGTELDRAIIFLDKSPLVEVAELKGGQFATYETALLNVPYNISKQNILIAPFLLCHIEDSRKGGIDKTINIDNLIDSMGYDGRRDHLAKHIDKCFAYWKSVKHISNYEIEKDGRGKAIRVKYTLPRKSKELPGR